MSALSAAPQVCKRMDMICQRVLNQGFLKVERYHSLCQRQVKAQLPRFVVAHRTDYVIEQDSLKRIF